MFLKEIRLLREKIESYEAYPFSIPAIRRLDHLDLKSRVTFFVGENGSGKSTLLEAVADMCGFHTAGGGRNNTYDVHAAASDLGDYIRLSWMPKVSRGFFLRAESFYNFATHIEEVGALGGYGGRSLHKQSHGESFLSLFTNRFQGKAVYLLDEPEAALSPQRQLSSLKILHDLETEGDSQFLIATHSPILLGYPNADILSFDGGKIERISYEETDHYQITRAFLENKERILDELFREEEG
ncbi:AAA family ATPase [Bacillus sp. SB49]|uniref:AAA family ATPase n=1 Tax=Bacillus sp. SB49 TaxID=1071080 RepID=UPI000408069E|nr:AAA family ATPase [Bacillus sp. SB49]QHT46217.1 AAA family ATPase [Bacillus sp. SB49]